MNFRHLRNTASSARKSSARAGQSPRFPVTLGTRRRRPSLVALALIMLPISVARVSAASWTWNGSQGNDHWSNTPNWSPVGPVANDGTANVIFAGNVRLTPDMNGAWSINSLAFAATAGNFSLMSSTGSTLTIGAGGITDDSPIIQYINHPLALGAAQTWNINQLELDVFGSINNGGKLLTVNVTAPAVNSLVGLISGTGGLTKNGTGTLSLTGANANTFSGPITVNDGTLALGKVNGMIPTAAFASTTLNVGDGIGAAESAIVSNLNSGNLPTGTLVAASVKEDGLLNFTPADSNESIASLTMRGGSVQVGFELDSHGDVTTLASSSTATISHNFFYMFSSGPHTFSVAQGTTPSGIDLDISSGLGTDSNPIIKTGPGTMRLSISYASPITGGFIINAGTVLIGNNLALGTGILTINSGTIAADGAARVLTNPVNFAGPSTVNGSFDLTLMGGLSGAGPLIKNGPATLALVGASTFTGPITINAGTLLMFASLGGNVTNLANFSYSGGNFAGRLINAGTVNFVGDFTAGNGIENDTLFSIPAGRTITTNGNGLDNEGILTMAGGALVLSATHANLNNGIFTLNASTPFMMSGATLLNAGTFNLAGALVSGPGTLTNNPGGTITGQGIIASTFSNSGGAVAVQDATTTRITQAFSNTGVIQLSGTAASLTGGTITNAGTIQGQGNIANAIINNGTIDPTGGTLALGGGLTNSAAGTLTASPGAKILITGAFPTNAGLIALSGGTFDTNNQPLTNTGTIAGYGTLRTGGLTNNNLIEFASGNGQVFGAVTSSAASKITVTQGSVATFYGSVTLNSTIFQVAPGATAIFFGPVTGNSNLAGGGIIDFESGHSPLANAIVNSAAVQVQSPAAVDLPALQSASLYLAGNVTIAPNGTAAGLSILGALTAAPSGKLDLANNDLLIHNSTPAAIIPLLQSAFANGTWTGSGITSSSAALPANAGQALGILSGADYHTLTPGALFDGQTVSPTDVLIKYTYQGDADLSGTITLADYALIDSGFFFPTPNPTWLNGDFNYDGLITFKDYALIDFAFTHQSPGPLAAAQITAHTTQFGDDFTTYFASLTPVPEPSALALILAAAPILRPRRPRNPRQPRPAHAYFS